MSEPIKKKRTRSRSKGKKKTVKKKRFDLIVFDIDSTLFDSLDKEDGKVSVKADHKLTHGGEQFKMYARPYLDAFIKFCQKNFKRIALWTHADRLWLQKFIDNVLPNGVELLFKYHSSHGEEKEIGKEIPQSKVPKSVLDGKKSNTVRLKPLEKIYKEYPEFNSDNTLIIEDTEENCIENLKNCIIVPEFSVVKHDKGDPDIVLPLLAKYLLKLQNGVIKDIDRKGWYHKELREFNKKKQQKEKVVRKRSPRRKSKSKKKVIKKK